MAPKSSRPSPQPPAPSPQVSVLLGPARAGKTHSLVGRYHDALNAGQAASLDRALWIAPSSRSVAAVRELLVARGQDAYLSPGITTFDNLADTVLLAAGNRSRSIAPVLQRELLRRVIAHALDAGKLKYFADAARRASFAEQLAEHIRELKRHDVAPAAYERISDTRPQSPQHKELAGLYTDYEQQLAAHQLIDRESAHAASREAFASGLCPRFQQLDLLVADGFTDFTRTQLEIIRLLASRSKQLFISLPDDPPPSLRPDLFGKTADTLASLQHFFPNLKREHLPARCSTWPTIDYISESIFRHPKPAPSAEALRALDHIEIVEAAGAQDEIIQLARRIKQRLTAGDSPAKSSDIVVVFRSVNEVAPRVEEVFERFGIPYSIETDRRIARSPVFQTLTALLRLEQEDWPFRRVVSVITNNTLSTLSDPARRAADWLVRDLQVASGRRQLVEIVTRLAELHSPESKLSEHQQKRTQAAAAALPALTQITEALDQLPSDATLTEWSMALANLLTTLAQPLLTTNATAWQTITANFAALERLDAWLGGPARKLSRSEMLATLVDVATREALPRTNDEIGRVRVLSAKTARAVTARHVYLAGMSEQSFPRADRQGRLATDAQYRFLANAAHQKANVGNSSSSQAPSRAQDEMLLFYEVLSRAEKTLTISYPALDDKAQDLPPSPYIVELLRMLGEHAQQISIAKPQLSPVPEHANALDIFSVADWRVAAMSQATQTDGDLSLLAGMFARADTKRLCQAIDAGVRIVHARAHGDKFGPSEGLLTSPAAAASLSQRFGTEHFWSPSQFETYAACPYKFYLANVLKLEPLGNLVLETDFARRGSLLHKLLAAFHRKYDESSAGEWSALWCDEPRFLAELKNELRAITEDTPHEGIEAAMLELDRRQIDKWTDLYRGQHEKYSGAWSQLDEPPRPTHFELRFGRPHQGEGSDEDSHSTDQAFQLDIGGESIHIAGRIDRIDVGRIGDQTVFNVIDYKSGRRPTLTADKIVSGERLQPALYVMAAQTLIFGDENAAPLWAGYWSMQGGVTTDKRYSLHCSVESGQQTWEELRAKVIARIGKIVRATRRGEFPVDSRDPDCTSICDFKTVCRVAQVRSVGKVWALESTASPGALALGPTTNTNPKPEIRNRKS